MMGALLWYNADRTCRIYVYFDCGEVMTHMQERSPEFGWVGISDIRREHAYLGDRSPWYLDHFSGYPWWGEIKSDNAETEWKITVKRLECTVTFNGCIPDSKRVVQEAMEEALKAVQSCSVRG